MRNLLFAILATGIFMTSCGTTSRVKKDEQPETEIADETSPPEPTPGGKRTAGSIIESGIASWYGPKFHGKLTANGERYDMYGLTAAHRTLPFNTIVKVKNLDNGKTVKVRVNDRGPFAKNRIIDLSKKAAGKLDMIGPGTANVSLVLVEGDLQNSRTTNLKVPTFTVQLGSFQSEAAAFSLSRKIRGSRVENISLDSRAVYRVYFGTYVDKSEARQQLEELQKQGFSGYVKQIQN